MEETGKQKAQSTSEPEEVYLTHDSCLIAQKGSQATQSHYSTEEQGTQATALNTFVGVIQSLTRVLTLFKPADCSMPGLAVHH